MFFAMYSLAEGRSKPMAKTRNDYFHQSWLTCVNGAVHNMLLQFLTLRGSKIEVFETIFSIPRSPEMAIQGV